MMKKITILLLFYLQLFISIAQTLKDTVHLQEVNVSASSLDMKKDAFSSGKKIQYVDSMIKQLYALNNLSEILNYQTSVFVKNYAPGNIASTSIRGGNAQQTMILWNGMNINHPMLGQSDLSLITTGIFDKISVEYGASSSLWGSPAMNGAVRLENNFSKKKNINLKYRYGSFNTNQISGKMEFTHKKTDLYVQPYYNFSKNNYTIGDSLQLKNASFFNTGIISGIQYRISKKYNLQFHSWWNMSKRHIPNNFFYNQYAALQNDQSFRNVLDFVVQQLSFKAGIKASYIFDGLDYQDSFVRINSKSKVHTIQTEENFYKDIFFKNIKWMLGHQWIFNYAITNNYLNDAQINRHSVFTGIHQNFKKLSYNILVRKEWANIQSQIPITGNIGIQYQINQTIGLKIETSKNYRLPTMNDFYWKGSGDVLLKPESSYEYAGSIVLNLKLNKWYSQIFSEWTAFNRYTDNWIIWLPGGNGNPVPANIAKVWSRGAETSSYWLFEYNKIKIKTSVNTAYILSTVEKSKINNDASIGRQLIYTPRYNINGTIQIIIKKYFCVLTHQYVGYRFISSDNLHWLNPYQATNLSIGKTTYFKKLILQISGTIHNLLNTSYMIISQRPMPGRNFALQIILQDQ